MPFTVNGIGVCYYGKRNRVTRAGSCECTTGPVEQIDYDATSYFVVVFVPVCPLGRKRIMGECTQCGRMRVMSLRKWRRLKAETIDTLRQELMAAPADVSKARESIAAAVFFDDEDALLDVAGLVEDRHVSDADVQNELGAAWSHFGHHDDAAAAYRAAFDMEDSTEHRFGLALALMRCGRPDEAAPLLEPVFHPSDQPETGMAHALVESYQEAGRHQEALAVLDRVAGAFPGEAASPEHKRLRKRATRHLQSGTPVKPDALYIGTRSDGEAGQASGLASRMPAAIAFAILLVGAVVVGSFFLQNERDVWIVNGTEVEYGVRVNGVPVVLPPRSHRRIEVELGTVTVAMTGTTVPFPDQTCTIDTPFFLRPFGGRTWVINPDRTAPLEWEEVVYAKSRSQGAGGDWRLYVGELLYEWEGIDYEFRDFPRSITTSSSSKQHRKQRIGLADLDVAGRVFILHGQQMEDRVPALVSRAIQLDPDDGAAFDQAIAWLPPEQFLELAEPWLAERPLRLEWHRAYQQIVLDHEIENELAAEYRRHLEAAPDDPVRIYLDARLLVDPIEQEQRFLEAITKGLESTRPHQWTIMSLTSRGEFGQALDVANRLAAAEPDAPFGAWYQIDALSGLGRIDEALQVNTRRLRANPLDEDAVSTQVALLCRLGRTDAADSVVKAAIREARSELDGPSATHWEAHLRRIRLYQDGDADAFAASLDGDADPEAGLQRAFTLGRPADMLAAIESGDGEVDYLEHLWLASLAMRENDDDLARRALAAAIDDLAGWDDHQFDPLIAWLGDGATPDPEQVVRYPLPRPYKLALLTAMGFRHAEHRQRYFDLARRLNCDTRFPYLTLRDLLAE